MIKVRNVSARIAALAVIALVVITAPQMVANATTVQLEDSFDRVGLLNSSSPDIGSELWDDVADNFVTTGDAAFLDSPGSHSRANYPLKLDDEMVGAADFWEDEDDDPTL